MQRPRRVKDSTAGSSDDSEEAEREEGGGAPDRPGDITVSILKLGTQTELLVDTQARDGSEQCLAVAARVASDLKHLWTVDTLPSPAIRHAQHNLKFRREQFT
jgi:hypothetical protein